MRQLPNIRKKRMWDEAAGRWVTVRVSTSAIRTITKVGLRKAIAKAVIR